MKDIARKPGVSLLTISKALRDHSDNSEAGRRRVFRRARELGYQPNWAARNLVAGHT